MDARKRERERGAADGDPHTEARALIERARAGEFPREKLVLLAYAGHAGLGPQLVEDVAEWCAFHQLDEAVGVVLGDAVDASAFTSWLVGLAVFDPGCTLVGMTATFPVVRAHLQTLEPDPSYVSDFYAIAFEDGVSYASQSLTTACDAVEAWLTTDDSDALRASLEAAAEHCRYLGGASIPRDFDDLFGLLADVPGWKRSEFLDLHQRCPHHVKVGSWSALLAATGVDLQAALAAAQAAVQARVLAELA